MIYKKIKFWKRLFLDQSVYPKKLKNKSIGKKENGCTSRGKTITAHLGFKAERHGRSSPSRHMKDCLEKKKTWDSRGKTKLSGLMHLCCSFEASFLSLMTTELSSAPAQ